MRHNIKQEMLKLPAMLWCPKCGDVCDNVWLSYEYKIYVHMRAGGGARSCYVSLDGVGSFSAEMSAYEVKSRITNAAAGT